MEEEVETRVCTLCGEELPLTTEYFYFRPDRYLFTHKCRECLREYAKKNNKKHLDEDNDAGVRWQIPPNPNEYDSEEQREAVFKFLKSCGWQWNAIFKTWVKKGIKIVKDGKVVWVNIPEEENNKRTYRRKDAEELLELSMKYRTTTRPPYETLKEQIKQYGYRGTGKIYGVSDNAVRKWLRFYINYLNV